MKLYINGEIRKCKILPAPKGCYYWGKDDELVIPALLAIVGDEIASNGDRGYSIYDISSYCVGGECYQFEFFTKDAYLSEISSHVKRYVEGSDMDYDTVIASVIKALKDNGTIIQYGL